MTSRLRAKKTVPLVRMGKPLSAETVKRAIARVRRERDRENLGKHIRKRSKSAKRSNAPKTIAKEGTL
jgi:hypothetical protein